MQCQHVCWLPCDCFAASRRDQSSAELGPNVVFALAADLSVSLDCLQMCVCTSQHDLSMRKWYKVHWTTQPNLQSLELPWTIMKNKCNAQARWQSLDEWPEGRELAQTGKHEE